MRKKSYILGAACLLALAFGGVLPAEAGPIKAAWRFSRGVTVKTFNGSRKAWNACVYRPACWVSKRCEPLEGLAVCTGSGINAYAGARNLMGR